MAKESKKILVVEDERFLREIISEKLKDGGFVVYTAETGAEGLRIALKEHPDLMLVDIIMPEMDGITMFQELRRDPWGKNVPAIFLTNLSDPDTMTKAAHVGVNDFWVKADMQPDTFVEKIRKKLHDITEG